MAILSLSTVQNTAVVRQWSVMITDYDYIIMGWCIAKNGLRKCRWLSLVALTVCYMGMIPA